MPEEGKGGKDLLRIGVVGNGRRTASRKGRDEGRKEKEGFVEDKCGWQREPKQHAGMEGRKEGKKGWICSG